MPQWGVELTSNDPALLSFLAQYRKEPSWSVVEVEGRYYLLSSSFQGLTKPEEARQAADNLLFLLNGILKLKFKSAHLDKAGKVVYLDNNGQLINTTTSITIPMRANISAGEPYYQSTDAQQLSSMDILLKAQNNPLVEEALLYYANPHMWFNLLKVFEIIADDAGKSENSGKLRKGTFNKWTQGKDFGNKPPGKSFDFLQTAHSYHWSGLDARHSSVESQKRAGVNPMFLQEAIDYITDLLMKWLQSNP